MVVMCIFMRTSDAKPIFLLVTDKMWVGISVATKLCLALLEKRVPVVPGVGELT